MSAERDAEKKRQAKRNKALRREQQAKAMGAREPEDLQRDIRRLEREPNASKAALAQLAQLRDALATQLQARQAAYDARLAKHKRRLAKKGLAPQDSPFYDAVSNPFGLPPTREEEAANLRQQRLSTAAARKPPRPPGPPPPARATRFIPPLPREPWPTNAPVVPHPRQDLLDKDAIDRQVRDSERLVRQAERAERAAALTGAAVSDAAGPTDTRHDKYETQRRQLHAAIHEPVPAAADVVVDPLALRLVPTAVRLKRDAAAAAAQPPATVKRPRAADAPPAQAALDTALDSFLQDIDDLNS
jgi:hypothetical protein